MAWGVDDWELWSPWTRGGVSAERNTGEWTADLLRRLPGTQGMRLADVGSSLSAALPATAVRFGEVVAVDHPETLRTRTPAARGELGLPHGGCTLTQMARGGRRFHAAVALDPWRHATRGDTDHVLRALWCGLAEGGILVVTVPARRAERHAFEMLLSPGAGDDPCAFHEIELQYLLRRAGYQGIRMRGLTDDAGGRLLAAMAVRRANN